MGSYLFPRRNADALTPSPDHIHTEKRLAILD